MRSRLLLLATAASLAASLSAQRLFDLGLKGGLNLDDLSTSYSHDPILGGHAGVFARVKPPLFPGIQGEVLLSSMGTSANIDGVETQVRSLSLQLPLFLVMNLGPVELHAGGYYDHFLAESVEASLDLDVEGVPVEAEDLKDGTLGVLAGAGVHLGRFYGGARYNWGMDDIGTGPFLDAVKSRQAQVYIGWGFFK